MCTTAMARSRTFFYCTFRGSTVRENTTKKSHVAGESRQGENPSVELKQGTDSDNVLALPRT